MTIENLRIDTTTRSTVFNPMSAAGQWLCSVFGKRSIGVIDVSYPALVESTQELPDLKSITLYSEYGDSLEWKYAANFILVMTVQGVFTMVNTYGMGKNSIYQLIKDASVEVIFDVDGMYEQSGKVFLNSDWKIIKENIRTLGAKARVKFYKFKHNAHQQKSIENFCSAVGANLEIVEDPLFGGKIFSVIDESGKWLYDIHHADSKQPTLCKTVVGWSRLRTRLKKITGTPIDELKKLSVPLNAVPLDSDDMINITIKGHVIKGSGISQIFSNALCGDWSDTEIDTSNQYNASALYELAKFARKDLSTISIYKNKINDILQFM